MYGMNELLPLENLQVSFTLANFFAENICDSALRLCRLYLPWRPWVMQYK
jgi:hypothetical protein